MKKFLEVFRQHQLPPEEQTSNIPDLTIMVKDFLDKVQRNVEYFVEGKIERHFGWLDVQVHNSNVEMKAALREQNVQITSAMNELKNSMLTANHEIENKVLHSEATLLQKAEDSEKRGQENLEIEIDKLEEKLTHQHQEVEEQLQLLSYQTLTKHMDGINARLDGLSVSLADQEAAYTQVSENCKTEVMTLFHEKCQALENNIKAVAQETIQTMEQSEKMTEVIKEFHSMKSQIMEDAAKRALQLKKQKEEVDKSNQSSQENVKRQIIQCSTQFSHKNQEVEEKLKTHMTEQIEKTERFLETKLTVHQENIEKAISGSTNTVIARLENIQEVEAELKTDITQVILKSEESIKEEMGKVKTETIQQIKQSSNDSTQTTKSEIEAKLKSNTETVKHFIRDVKRELFQFTEKECSITRLKIADPTTKVRSCIFDLYVKNFKDLVKSGKYVHSVPWHIDEFQSCVEGDVLFQKDGAMNVYLFYGRHHLEMGLRPRHVRLKVKVTITDRTGNLPDLVVAEKTWNANEEDVKDNRGWGCHIGTVNCDDVIKKQYHMCKGYWYEAVLFRYHIDVL